MCFRSRTRTELVTGNMTLNVTRTAWVCKQYSWLVYFSHMNGSKFCKLSGTGAHWSSQKRKGILIPGVWSISSPNESTTVPSRMKEVQCSPFAKWLICSFWGWCFLGVVSSRHRISGTERWPTNMLLAVWTSTEAETHQPYGGSSCCWNHV